MNGNPLLFTQSRDPNYSPSATAVMSLGKNPKQRRLHSPTRAKGVPGQNLCHSNDCLIVGASRQRYYYEFCTRRVRNVDAPLRVRAPLPNRLHPRGAPPPIRRLAMSNPSKNIDHEDLFHDLPVAWASQKSATPERAFAMRGPSR